MTFNAIENIVDLNKYYYPDFNDLFELIANPSFNRCSDDFSRRYIVKPGYEYSLMRFALIYNANGDLILYGDIGEDSYFYELVGYINYSMFKGDDLMGFSLLFDLILQDTVPTEKLFKSYAKNLLFVEGRRYNEELEEDYPIYFLNVKNNPDIYSESVDKLWDVPDIESIHANGIHTISQLKSAIDIMGFSIDDTSLLSLSYFDDEVYATNESSVKILNELNSSELASFNYTFETSCDELFIKVLTFNEDDQLSDIIDGLKRNGYIEEIVSSENDEVRAYINIGEDGGENNYVRLLFRYNEDDIE